jgi:phage terminase large subunit-like protein
VFLSVKNRDSLRERIGERMIDGWFFAIGPPHDTAAEMINGGAKTNEQRWGSGGIP